MTKKEARIIRALLMLKQDAPQYFEAIMTDCPSDLGLPAKHRKLCGMEDSEAEFTPEYC